MPVFSGRQSTASRQSPRQRPGRSPQPDRLKASSQQKPRPGHFSETVSLVGAYVAGSQKPTSGYGAKRNSGRLSPRKAGSPAKAARLNLSAAVKIRDMQVYYLNQVTSAAGCPRPKTNQKASRATKQPERQEWQDTIIK